MTSIESRIAALDWEAIARCLDEDGFAATGPILDPAECDALIQGYDRDASFRKRVVMARHNYGLGDYRYYTYPLPEVVAELRAALFPRLAPVANQWQERLRLEERFPGALAEYLAFCHGQGQTEPTPLILHYEAGGFNCLHQDLYGDHYFPMQVAILLSEPGVAFTGGEFVLVEQRPRAQSTAAVVPLQWGSAVFFAVNKRPAKGARGYHRRVLRHGVSRLHAGRRFTLGIIFHDAKPSSKSKTPPESGGGASGQGALPLMGV